MKLEIPTDIYTYPDVPLPDVWTVEQLFDTPALKPDALEAGVRDAVATLCQDKRLKQGARVAVGCGSRGVNNIQPVVRTVIAELKQRGMEPFIVPAMGSHGGAKAEGQKELLLDYGLTPEEVGAEIHATMEVDELGALEGPDAGPFAGHPLYIDRNAHGADAILLVNRIKPHTDFQGDIESGIGKMCAIGLGKRKQAEAIHRYGARGLRELMPRVARALVERTAIVGGVGLIENELGQTAEVHAVPATDVARAGESTLLKRARDLEPRLPFADLDVLVVDEMGKNISGTGMDTHAIGRAMMPSIPEDEWDGPKIRIIVCLDLTAPTHGNAAGLGLADVVTRKLMEKVDFQVTWTNTRTSGEGGILKSRVPLVLETSDEAVQTAIGACGKGHASEVRLARIRNTADMRYIEISEALLKEACDNKALKVSEKARNWDTCRPVGAAY